ncbi:hypothetical protein M405DRAFT_29931 [Rhizopogon salebrosus TDB-379]|nr:hypothetical protein M405DRAFT_29931 [Rhizopogon salebrosus TDB-379]
MRFQTPQLERIRLIEPGCQAQLPRPALACTGICLLVHASVATGRDNVAIDIPLCTDNSTLIDLLTFASSFHPLLFYNLQDTPKHLAHIFVCIRVVFSCGGSQYDNTIVVLTLSVVELSHAGL